MRANGSGARKTSSTLSGATLLMKIEPSGPDVYRQERRSVFRRVGVIHDDHRYDAVMRNLSKTGAAVGMAFPGLRPVPG